MYNSLAPKTIIENLKDTEDFAKEFAKYLKTLLAPAKSSLTIGLMGGLGVGKTTFIKYLCEALKIEVDVSSPTFILQNIYQNKSKAGSQDQLTIEHWDVYRVPVLPEELYEVPEKNTIRLIEWADKFSNLSNKNTENNALILDLMLKFESNNVRTVEIVKIDQ